MEEVNAFVIAQYMVRNKPNRGAGLEYIHDCIKDVQHPKGATRIEVDGKVIDLRNIMEVAVEVHVTQLKVLRQVSLLSSCRCCFSSSQI